ncbi:MAG: hypothetical protein ACI9FG_000380 [Crocinitomicaceae bacterium]|jgi:hypothetical protein
MGFVVEMLYCAGLFAFLVFFAVGSFIIKGSIENWSTRLLNNACFIDLRGLITRVPNREVWFNEGLALNTLNSK